MSQQSSPKPLTRASATAKPISATDPEFICTLCPHIWDTDNQCDQHFDKDESGWTNCKWKICPNRYDIPTVQANPPSYSEEINKSQEKLAQPPKPAPQPTASTSQPAQKISRASSQASAQPKTQTQTQTSSQPPLPPPQAPSPAPSHHSIPSILIEDIPCSPSPPDGDNPGADDEESDSDSDDNNNMALKAFDKVTILKADGSN